MIDGIVTDRDIPQITMSIGGREFLAVVDSGFNGYLELPRTLQPDLELVDAGIVESTLAADQIVYEQCFRVDVEFDDQIVDAIVTFAGSEIVLLGTKMLLQHRLEIDFPSHKLRIERTESGNGQLTTDN
jgi:predicted aspartyl protease